MPTQRGRAPLAARSVPARTGSRSPAPEERQRDAERTRRALLDAALVEFSAKGFAGARVSQIAARAGVNKQLISYYFGGKEGLYQALVERWQHDEAQFARPELALEALVVQYLEANARQRDTLRMFVRDGLAYEPSGDQAGPQSQGVAPEVADMARRQKAGEIAADLDPALVLIMLIAATSVGVTIPHEVKRVTGLEATSPEFVARYGDQLRRIVRRLVAPSD